MKYNELHRLLRKAGCYPTGRGHSRHPQWYSPLTGEHFLTSHHLSEEVRNGTLKAILKAAGVKL